MSKGRPKDKSERESCQVELARRFFKAPAKATLWFPLLKDWERELLFQEFKSHHSLYVAEGHGQESGQILHVMEYLAKEHDRLAYDHKRLQIKEFERLGLGGRALNLMGELYKEQGRSRKEMARAAEIVMEYGILHDRYGEKEEALRLFKNSIGRYERAEHPYNLVAAWFNSASVHYDLNSTQASFNACEKGLDLNEDRFLDLKTHLLLQRANCFEKVQKPELACADYLEAARGYGELGNRRQQTNILFRVGWLLGRQKKDREAREQLEEALRIARELDYAAGLALFHLHRAQFLSTLEGSREKAIRHLQQCLPFAKIARLDRAEKMARGLLYRLQGAGERPLTFYMKARAPECDERTLARAARGTYSHRGNDGAATRTWRDSPRSAGKDVTFLVRLLAEMGRRAERPSLLRQSRAVKDWQQYVKQGRRIL